MLQGNIMECLVPRQRWQLAVMPLRLFSSELIRHFQASDAPFLTVTSAFAVFSNEKSIVSLPGFFVDFRLKVVNCDYFWPILKPFSLLHLFIVLHLAEIRI
jgi:hypothetical protein